MKCRVSQKEIKSSFSTVLSFGYCEVQAIFKGLEPFAYSCGVYGWNCDYYEFGGVCVSTGYRPIGKDVSHEIVKRYNVEAEKLWDWSDGETWEQKTIKGEAMAQRFINECVNSLK